jgi:hypothetical protein
MKVGPMWSGQLDEPKNNLDNRAKI